jgi:hypothetical protein
MGFTIIKVKRAIMDQDNESGLTKQEKIAANAELVIRFMRKNLDVELKYDKESVKWID